MLQCIRQFVHNPVPPKVIVIDRELALKNAIQAVFPESAIIICIWHINEKVLAKCKEVRLNDEVKDEFMRLRNDIIKQPTEELFNDDLQIKIQRLCSRSHHISSKQLAALPEALPTRLN